MTNQFLWSQVAGVVHSNVSIPKTGGGFWPNLTDFYVPTGTALAAVVCLHGGGGDKISFAQQLHVLTSGNAVNWQLLNGWNTITVFPMGQHCNGQIGPENPYGVNTENSGNDFEGTPTWTNHSMLSQNDDLSFLQDLSSYITTTYGSVGKSLLGHSNGGMMVRKMLWESPTTFGHYGAISGPTSNYYVTNNTLPGTIRPIWMQYGALDDVLDISGGPSGPGSHWTDSIWINNSAHYSIADVAYNPNTPPYFFPTLQIGETYASATWANALGQSPALGTQINEGDGVVTSIAVGTKTEWSYAGGKLFIRLLSQGNHQINTQDQALGYYFLKDFFSWVKAN